MAVDQLTEFGDIVDVMEDWDQFVELASAVRSRHRYCFLGHQEGQLYLKAVVGGQIMVGYETRLGESQRQVEQKAQRLRELGFMVTRFVRLRSWVTAPPAT